ncbi:MAG TPA: hypothetical protein VHK91_06725, partial [Flavisolibacter sp.]|nr:hypothetical protein [Flavisolibacter sp.]
LTYEEKSDSKEAFSTYQYIWNRDTYQRVEIKFPAHAHAVFLNQILHGGSDRYKLVRHQIWKLVDPAADDPALKNKKATEKKERAAQEGFLKKLVGLFRGKKPIPSNDAPTPAQSASTHKEPGIATPSPEVPFLTLWNRLPQAFVQLLISGRMETLHQFALMHLKQHPEFHRIKEMIDAATIEQLLLSEFTTPAEWAFELARERYQPDQPDLALVKAMLYGKYEPAQHQAMAWVDQSPDAFLNDPGFVAALLISPNPNCRKWLEDWLSRKAYAPEAAADIVNRTVLHFLSFHEVSTDAGAALEDAARMLPHYFSNAVASLSLEVITHLLHSRLPQVQHFGVVLLLLRKDSIPADQLSSALFSSLLSSAYTPLRNSGLQLLQALSTAELLKRQELIIHSSTAAFPDVRTGM